MAKKKVTSKHSDKDCVKGQTKRSQGRLVMNVIKPIDSTPEELAQAICRKADRKLAQRTKVKN